MVYFMRRILFILFLLFFLARADSTTVVRVSFNDQAREADLIVVGRAVRVEQVQWRDFPFRRVVIAVDEVIAGEPPGDEIAVLQPGGRRKNGNEVRVQGLRYIKVGDELLLFLKLISDDNYEIIGLDQGRYSVSREPGTGRKVINIRGRSGKHSMTLEGAKRRVHAVRSNSRAGGKPEDAGQ